MNEEPSLIYPPDVDYECTQCGRCCSHPWEIPLDEASISRLDSVDWSQSKPELAGRPLVVPRSHASRGMTLERDGERCVFLEEGNRCLVHRAKGLEFKPRACQQFPYIFTGTPEGIYVGVSFATSGIRPGQGAPLRRHELQLMKLLEGAYHFREIGDEVVLRGQTRIAFSDYLAVERGLLTFLGPENSDLENDLIGGGIYLDLFQEFLREETGKYRDPGTAFQEGWERLGYQRIRDIAAKFPPSPTAQRSFLTSFVMCVESALSSGSSVGHLCRATLAHLGAALKVGSINLKSLNERLPLKVHSAVRFPLDEEEIAGPLRQYLRHVIHRKRLMPYRGIRLGYYLLCIYFALIRWFAQARAALRGSSRVQEEDIQPSIELVERYYVLHTRFDEVFDKPIIQSLLKRAVRRKHFLGMIVRSGEAK